MAIRGARSIAEYAIRKWLENEGFVMEHFRLEFTNRHEAIVVDANGDTLRLEYDPNNKIVVVADM